MKLSTGLEKGVVSDDLSFASVQIDRNYWLTLPRRKKLCHKLSHDQPQPGSFFQRPREAEKRDPGNEVGMTREIGLDWTRKEWTKLVKHRLVKRGPINIANL